MPAKFKNFGIEFLYPDNWEVTDEQASGWPLSVAFQTPEGGIFVLQVHEATPPLRLAEEVLKTMREEYPALEADSAIDTVENQELVGFDLNFFYVDFMVSARVRAASIGPCSYVWFFQAENRDFDRLAPVCLAIETGLLRSVAAPR